MFFMRADKKRQTNRQANRHTCTSITIPHVPIGHEVIIGLCLDGALKNRETIATNKEINISTFIYIFAIVHNYAPIGK